MESNQSSKKSKAESRIRLGVSAQTFETRMKKLMREDTLSNAFKTGEFRGKIGDSKFYVYISEDGPKNTTDVMHGTYGDGEISFHYTKPRASYIFSGTLSLIFVLVAFVFYFLNGLAGLAFLIPVPFIVSPWFRKGKAGDKTKLENKIREISNKLA